METIPKVDSIRVPASIYANLVSADVARAIEVAFKYRNFFRKDIIIDLIVYRRWYVDERCLLVTRDVYYL